MKKQLLLTMALVLAAVTAFGQTLNIGGHRAPLDTLNNVWLCSVPQSQFGNDFTATVSFGEELQGVFIDGVAVTSGDEVTFRDLQGGKLYNVTFDHGDSIIEAAITFTWLPIVELFGEFTKEYSYTEIFISEPDSTNVEPMKAKIKTRGIATNLPGQHKLNYRIKFINDDSTKMNRRFFGLRKDNNWILDAGQLDFLRVRNRVSTDLWLDMASQPWYADTIANVRNGSRGQMVEVMLNGEYRGIYNMCEPIDRKQLKLERYDASTRTFHGGIWMAYRWTRNVAMSLPTQRTSQVWWNGFELKYPDFDEIRRSNWNALEEAVWYSYNSDQAGTIIDSLDYYFDIPVMKDYLIFIATLQALDNESKNIYYACHDVAENHRLTMIPWDLDICLGQNYSPDVNKPEIVKPERPLDWIYHVPMANLWKYWKTHNEIVARYKELRKTVLSTDSLVNRYRNAINNLDACGAVAREEARWSGDSDLAGKPLDLNAEMDYVENWLRLRMPYLDEFVFVEMDEPIEPEFQRGDVNGDGEVNIADINALIDIILGGQADAATRKRADVNEDSEINIADVNALIDIILG